MSVTPQYKVEPVGCDCGKIHGFIVVGPGMRTHRHIGRIAAYRACHLLNSNILTAHDINTLLGVADQDSVLAAAEIQLTKYYADNVH